MEPLKIVAVALIALLIAAIAGAFNGSNSSYVAWGIGLAALVLIAYMMVRR